MDSGDSSWCNRKRLFWPSFDLELEQPDVHVLRKPHWDKVSLITPLKPCSDWLDAGSLFPGEVANRRLPTFTRSIVRKRPPYKPAGIATLLPHEVEAWASDDWSEPAYQYGSRWTIQDKSGERRLASAREREKLLGFLPGHTFPAVQSSMLSKEAKAADRIRRALLGNSFSCGTVAWLLAHMLKQHKLAFRIPSAEEIAGGNTLDIGTRTKLDRTVTGGGSHRRPGPPELAMVRRVAAGVDHRGSDARIGLGEGLRPSAWPCREIAARAWRWKVILSMPWRQNLQEHINALEMRATLLALQWRARNSNRHYCRALHLSDSAVAIGVLTKRRSASFRLMPICRKVNALEIASSITLLHGFTRSAHNPADRPSRVLHSHFRTQRRIPRQRLAHGVRRRSKMG